MWFNCACGYKFHDNTDSLSFKGYVLADEDLVEFTESFDKYADAPRITQKNKYARDDIVCNSLNMLRTIYQCPKCGTVYFSDFNGNKLHAFVSAEQLEMDNVISEKLRDIAEKNEEENDEKNLLRSCKMFIE